MCTAMPKLYNWSLGLKGHHQTVFWSLLHVTPTTALLQYIMIMAWDVQVYNFTCSKVPTPKYTGMRGRSHGATSMLKQKSQKVQGPINGEMRGNYRNWLYSTFLGSTYIRYAQNSSTVHQLEGLCHQMPPTLSSIPGTGGVTLGWFSYRNVKHWSIILRPLIEPITANIFVCTRDVFSEKAYLIFWWDIQSALLPSIPRLCLHTLLCAAEGFVSTWAIKCSSWSAVNRGTSYRTPCTSLGYEEYNSVINSNLMAARFLEGLSWGYTVYFAHALKLIQRDQGYIEWNWESKLFN